MPRRFPDVQRRLVDLLTTIHGDGHAGTQTPANLASVLPFIRVRRGGGPSDMVSDYPIIDVDVFAATDVQGQPLAEDLREWLTGRPARWIDRVSCDIGPRELPHADETVRRYGATYTIVTRRQAT